MKKIIIALLAIALLNITPVFAQQPQTLEQIVTAARNGDLPSINMMGNLHKVGNTNFGMPVNIAEAKAWFEIGASKGYAPSMFNLGLFYENGAQGIPKDIEKARAYYAQAAKLGFIRAQERLAALPPKAVATIAPLAANALQALNGNWYSAQWKYGYTLQNGVGVATSTNSPNFNVGQNIIQLTATAPNKFSGQQVYTDGKFYNVTATLQPDGSLYFEGDKNVKWTMTRVGVANNVVASTTTESFEDGRTAYDAKDFVNALRIFTALANANDVRAQNYIGIMHSRGLGVAKDDVQAIKWFQLAAANGFSSAQLNLGARYRRGVGTEPNFSEALKWLRLAAAQNNANAQFELGLMYQMGQGVATNDAEAIRLYQLAAAQGNEQAKKSLDVLRPAVATAPVLAPQQQPNSSTQQTTNAATSVRPSTLASTATQAPVAIPTPSPHPPQIKNSDSKGDFEITLENKRNGSGDICYLSFKVKNNTDINFTVITFDLIYRDKNSIILGKSILRDGVKPRDVNIITKAIDKCSEHTSVEVVSPAAAYYIDGDFIFDKEKKKKLDSLRIVSDSKVTGISAITKGGLLTVDVASSPKEKWKEGVRYVHFSDGSCTPSNDKECMPIENYQAACSEAKNITKQAIVIRGVNAYGDEKKLIDGGSIDNIQIIWGENRKGKSVCTVTVDMSGLVNGNSVRKSISGNASEFILLNNKLLISQFGY